MAEAGAVAWQFNRSAYFSMSPEGKEPNAVFDLAVEAGAGDVNIEPNLIEIIGPVENFKSISMKLKGAGFELDEAEVRMIPSNEVELAPDETIQVLKVIDALEELDDVYTVYSTLNITDEAMAQLETA